MQQLQQDGGYDEAETAVTLATFFAVFYVDDAYLASQDARFHQHALTLLVDLFECVGLLTNTTKTQVMICTPRRIRTQLSSESYFWMKVGRITASEWNSRDIECYQCGKEMKASSLNRHLADVYDIYQQTMVSEDLLELPHRVARSQPPMPISSLSRTVKRWVDDAPPFLGHSPIGSHASSQGRPLCTV